MFNLQVITVTEDLEIRLSGIQHKMNLDEAIEMLVPRLNDYPEGMVESALRDRCGKKSNIVLVTGIENNGELVKHDSGSNAITLSFSDHDLTDSCLPDFMKDHPWVTGVTL